jgi:hypothetical protein
MYTGPHIISDGLVLAVDTASKRSYPRSGTTLFDLSGNNLNGTIEGSPSFLNSDNGVFDFDGIDDYISMGSSEAVDLIQNQTNFSLGVWFKMDALGTLRGLIGTLNYGCTLNLGLTANGTNLSFYNDTATCYSVSVGGVEIGKWIYGVGTYDGTTTRTYMFKDGNLTQASGTSKSGVTNTFSSDFQVWGDQNGTIETDCKGGIAHVYNRTLSQTEIEQNYNALKSRFI